MRQVVSKKIRLDKKYVMHKVIIILMKMSDLVVSACSGGKKVNSFYKGNPEPLVQNTYIRLPLGQ